MLATHRGREIMFVQVRGGDEASRASTHSFGVGTVRDDEACRREVHSDPLARSRSCAGHVHVEGTESGYEHVVG